MLYFANLQKETEHAYAEELLPALDAGMTVSAFSKAHNPYDNSVCEAFFKSIKAEELYRRRYRSMREFRNSVAAYIAEYNAKRPHAENNYLTPDEKESRWLASKTDEAVRSCPENQGINSKTEPPAQKSNAENSAANP